MTGKQLLKGWLKLAAILAVLAFALSQCGCGMTARQHMYLACGADAGVTYYALEVDGRYSEGSPLVDDDDWGQIAACNVLAIGVGEGAALVDPEHKDTYYWIVAVGKYVFACYNVGLMLSD